MYHAYIYIYTEYIYIYNQCVYKYHIHICTHYDKVHLKQWISTMVFRQGTWQKNSWFWKPQVCGSNLHTSMRWFCTTSDWMMASCNWDKARLVGGLEHFGFFHIMGVIIPTDELIFFRGVGQPPTSHWPVIDQTWPVLWVRWYPFLVVGLWWYVWKWGSPKSSGSSSSQAPAILWVYSTFKFKSSIDVLDTLRSPYLMVQPQLLIVQSQLFMVKS